MKYLRFISACITAALLFTSYQASAQNSVAELEQQLRGHPELADELVPRIEKMIVENILAKVSGKRFVIKGVEAEKDVPSCSATIRTASNGLVMFETEFPTDELLFTMSGRPIFIGNGSVHRYKGNVNAPVGDFTHFVSEDDKTNRLTFAVLEGIGYVYVRGKGKLVKRDGKEIKFGD